MRAARARCYDRHLKPIIPHRDVRPGKNPFCRIAERGAKAPCESISNPDAGIAARTEFRNEVPVEVHDVTGVALVLAGGPVVADHPPDEVSR